MGDCSSQRPRLTNLRGRGVLPRRQSLLRGGLGGMAAPNGPGSPASGGGESRPGGGW